jgi:hypothetical protein
MMGFLIPASQSTVSRSGDVQAVCAKLRIKPVLRRAATRSQVSTRSKENKMTVSVNKTALGALAALTLGLSVATPASAQYYRGGGWGGPGPAVAAGVLGGVALGAAAAGAANGPYYGPGPGYGGECWMERRPIVDEYGEVIGRRRVRVCN